MHYRTHTGEKPLTCDICGLNFRESSNLTKHRRTHDPKGMYECAICHRDFNRLDQVRRHLTTNHKDQPETVGKVLKSLKPNSRDCAQGKKRRNLFVEGFPQQTRNKRKKNTGRSNNTVKDAINDTVKDTTKDATKDTIKEEPCNPTTNSSPPDQKSSSAA